MRFSRWPTSGWAHIKVWAICGIHRTIQSCSNIIKDRFTCILIQWQIWDKVTQWTVMTCAKDSTLKGVQDTTHGWTSPVAFPSSPQIWSPLLISSSHPPLSVFLSSLPSRKFLLPHGLPSRVPAHEPQPYSQRASLSPLYAFQRGASSNPAWPLTNFIFFCP